METQLSLFIGVGDKVRSWDSEAPERRNLQGNWVEGIVEGIGPYGEHDNCPRYAIRVVADYWHGEQRSGEHSRVGMVVYPPVNGSRSFGGSLANGVELLGS
jgi:hypothetical protein